MIQDPAILKKIQQSWEGVVSLRKKYHAVVVSSFVFGGWPALHIADAVHNIPFIFACSVLTDVLEQLKNEGHFNCEKRTLGALVGCSKTKLPWLDYALIDELVEKRNDLAHRAELLPRDDCWKYIDAIESELKSWGIV